MSVQHLVEVTQIARAAKAIGATLPDQITAGLAHIDAMRAPKICCLFRQLSGFRRCGRIIAAPI